MADEKSVLTAALDALESGPFDYILYGGLAAGFWGEPRYTEDVDIVLFLHERRAARFLRAAAKAGFVVDEDLAIQQLQVSGWARLPLGGADSPWHLDMALGDTPFDRSAWERRKRIVLFNRQAWSASPEDLIVYKLVSGRDRDLMDVRQIVARGQPMDIAYLHRWADWWEKQGVKGVRAALEGLLGSASP